MSYTEKRDLLEAERTQNENAVKVLAQLQTLDSVLDSTLAEIDRIIALGSFELIDAEIVTPAATAITNARTLQTAYEAASLKEMLDWRP